MAQDEEEFFVLSSNLKETVIEGEDFLIEEVGDSESITLLRRGLKRRWRDRYDFVITTTSVKGILKLSMSHADQDVSTE